MIRDYSMTACASCAAWATAEGHRPGVSTDVETVCEATRCPCECHEVPEEDPMDDPLPPRCPSCDRLLVDDQGAARLRDELLAERFRGGPAFGPPASSGRARLATATRAIYRGEAEQ